MHKTARLMRPSGRNGLGRSAEGPLPGNNWSSVTSLLAWALNEVMCREHLARHFRLERMNA